MILDDSDIGSSGLYSAGPVPQTSQQQQPVAASASTSVAVSPSAAVGRTLEVIADPSSLLSEVLPPDPAKSNLPIGLAVLGLCVFGVIWANSIDLKGGAK